MFSAESSLTRRILNATTVVALGGLGVACSDSAPVETVPPYHYILPGTNVVMKSYCREATLKPVAPDPGSSDVKIELSRVLKPGLPDRPTELKVGIFGVGHRYDKQLRANAPLTHTLPSTPGEYLFMTDIVSGINGGEPEGDGYRNICPNIFATITPDQKLVVLPETWQQATPS